MRIVVAPDKFKGSLSAPAVAAAIAEGLLRADSSVIIDQCPMADGGEGTVAALVAATGGTLMTRSVTGPLPHRKVDATFGMLGDGQTAVIEMAAASGLALLKEEDRNPLNTTTFGTGELLLAAMEIRARNIILGIGGSATMDAGIGCAQACGFSIVFQKGNAALPTKPLCGRDLDSIATIEPRVGSEIERVRITVACDVTNPLFGPNGAAAVFGPQKGATPQQVEWFDQALQGLAQRTGTLKEALTPGAGAAGGLGFGMLAFFGASLRPGAEIVIDATALCERLKGADLCITGEGRLDAQSLSGKAPIAVARLCKELNIPCIALVGSIGPGAKAAEREGLRSWFAIADGTMNLQQSIEQAPSLLAQKAEELMQRIRKGWRP